MIAFSPLKVSSIFLVTLLSAQLAQAQTPAPLGTPYFNGATLVGNQANRFYIKGTTNGADGPYLQFHQNTDSFSSSQGSQQGTLTYVSGYSTTTSNIAHNFVVRQAQGSSIGWPSYMRILQSGQVLIGQLAPQTQTDYALGVDGKLVTKSLYVTQPANWADFVFSPDYHLTPLHDLETYLQSNRHLPALPSASQVQANGYSVTEMDSKLLQTVEELTLRIIQLNKRIEQLEAANGRKTVQSGSN